MPSDAYDCLFNEKGCKFTPKTIVLNAFGCTAYFSPGGHSALAYFKEVVWLENFDSLHSRTVLTSSISCLGETLYIFHHLIPSLSLSRSLTPVFVVLSIPSLRAEIKMTKDERVNNSCR